jgi:hypothetical protein
MCPAVRWSVAVRSRSVARRPATLSVRVVAFHDSVLIGNDIAKITARRRGYEICSSVAEEDPNTLPCNAINVYWLGRIKAIRGRERRRAVGVYSHSPRGCG